MASARVGTLSAHRGGLYNVHGNVWEWTEDCRNDSNNHNPGYGRARSTGDCGGRIVRGESWYDDPGFLRSAYRFRRNAATAKGLIFLPINGKIVLRRYKEDPEASGLAVPSCALTPYPLRSL